MEALHRLDEAVQEGRCWARLTRPETVAVLSQLGGCGRFRQWLRDCLGALG
jgi:hypothetical protein